jgi:hypothetical protein
VIDTRKVSRGDTLKLELAPGGGQAILFSLRAPLGVR